MRRLLASASAAARAIALAALVVLAACEPMALADDPAGTDVRLTRGAALADHIGRQPAEALSDEEVVALGYLERARLGVGSPFRLMEFALHDPLLAPEIREGVAFALLWQTLRADVYRVDPAALGYVPLAGALDGDEAAWQQLRLIERTIAAAPTARSGERAVRLGYRLAEAEGVVGVVPFSVVAHAAALVSDRRRAGEDAGALLRAAEEAEADPLVLLGSWRRERRFDVEGPVMRPGSVREEEWEAREAPRVALALRTLSQRLRGRTSLVNREARGGRTEASLLSAEAADRLRRIAERRDYPPQAPIAVALGIHRGPYLEAAHLTREEREARRRFVDESWSEERLVAGARLLGTEAGGRHRLPLIVMQAAILFRVWNQEEPWFPGDPAPAARDVAARFGLAGIDFDESVPAGWRPFYVRVLARGLGDLSQVLPTASVRGLRVRVGPVPPERGALALHDPATRTLVLPTHTGAGTLAHEVAHDLDWQLARKRYGRRGGYATDLSVRAGQGDRIASSVVGLAAALTRPSTSPARPHDTRPAEVFARGSDWLVAAMLARQGRTGGYLTSYQDAELTGYGTTRGPDVGGGAVPNLLSLLGAVAPVVDGSRDWALDQFGPNRTLTPAEMVQPLLDTGVVAPQGRGMEAITTARDRALSSLSNASCRLSSAPDLRRLITAQRALIRSATAAALRGAAVREVRELARETLGDSAADVEPWLVRRLYGAPEPVSPAVDSLAPALEEILLRAELIARREPPEIGTLFDRTTHLPLCASNPFAAPAPRRRVPPARSRAEKPLARTPLLGFPESLLPAAPWRAAY